MSKVPAEQRVTQELHGVTIGQPRSKADTQAVLIRGLGLGPVEAHEKSERFGPKALEAELAKSDR